MKITYILMIIVLITPIQQSTALNTLHYNYSLNQDKSSNKYVFSITFTDNITIYAVNMSINNITYLLQAGLQKNSFFTYLPTKIENVNLEFKLVTSEGPKATEFRIKNTNEEIITLNTIITGILFLILVILIAKYVLFYEVKKSH